MFFNSVREVVEQFNCWAIIEKRGVRENLGTSIIRANFIVPVVEVSEVKLEFDINVGPEDSQDQVKRSMQNSKISYLKIPQTIIH